MSERREFSYYNSIQPAYRREYYIGEAALQLRGVLKLMYPVSSEEIEDWTAIEKILHHTYYTDLRVDPSEHITVFCPPYNCFTEQILEKTVEIFFESFNAEGLFIIHPAVASLAACGRTNGMILYLGPDLTQATCLHDSSIINQTIKKADYGKRHVIQYMRRLLRQKGHDFRTSAELEIVRDICEKLCYVSSNPKLEITSRAQVDKFYTLPDGETIVIKEERIMAPEAYFNPSLIGSEADPVPVLVKKSYFEVADELKSKFNTIIITGMGAFTGMDKRLERELRELLPDQKFKILIDPQHWYSDFIGASILGSDKLLRNKHVLTLEEYNAVGPTTIHKYILK